jgi:hypothetical protein
VFPSKFCHFLLPRIFPVVDNRAASGSPTYENTGFPLATKITELALIGRKHAPRH